MVAVGRELVPGFVTPEVVYSHHPTNKSVRFSLYLFHDPGCCVMHDHCPFNNRAFSPRITIHGT